MWFTLTAVGKHSLASDRMQSIETGPFLFAQ